MDTLRATTPLLWRVVAFLILFVVISGVSGPRIIASHIFEQDGFWIYGGVGKASVFCVIAFLLLVRHDLKPLTKMSLWRWPLLGWFCAAFGTFVLAWIGATNLIAGQENLQNLVMAHAGLIFGLVFVALGCFGYGNLRLLWRSYRLQMGIAVVTAVCFYALLQVVYALWQPLAGVVMVGVQSLLGATGLAVSVVPPYTLMLDKFSVTIAEPCSGVESIALFTGLYALVGLLDWRRLHVGRYIAAYPISLLILFGLNILRVYGLIAAGYYINPVIAFSLFHTYAGLVFFIVYSAVFWAVAYRLLIKPSRSL